MNETEMLALGKALARTADVLRRGEQVRMAARARSRPSAAPGPSPAGAHAGRAEPGRGPADLLELTPSHCVDT